MDLTKFLRKGIESDVESSPKVTLSTFSLPPAVKRIPSEEARNERQALHKKKGSMLDLRTRGAIQKKVDRKESVFKKMAAARGVSVADGELDEGGGDGEEVTLKEVKPLPREPLKEKPTRSNATQDRLKRLEEFRQAKLRKKEEDLKSKKPPFKVGAYKFHQSVTTENLKFGAGHSSFVFGKTHNQTGNLRRHDRCASVMSNQSRITPKPDSTRAMNHSSKLKSGNSKILPSVKVTHVAATASPKLAATTTNTDQVDLDRTYELMEVEEQPDLTAIGVKTDEEKRVEVHQIANAAIKSPTVDDYTQTDSPILTRQTSTPEPNPVPQIAQAQSNLQAKLSTLSVGSGSVSFEPDAKDDQSCSTPKNNIDIANSVFKTPIGIATPRLALLTGRKNRRSGISPLMDSLRTDICMSRGSSADRQRKKVGRPEARTPAEILGLVDLFEEFDEGSPMSALLRGSELCSKESNVTPNSLKPLKLSDKHFGEDDQDKDKEQDPETLTKTEDVKDVPYFRKILKEETDKLEVLCEKWNAKIVSSLSEENQGHIRTAIGLARLGMDRKGRFKQFEGLIDDCEFKRGERETTCQDLQGFWDMISVQIEDAKSKFDDLEKLEANNWVMPQQEKKKVLKKKPIPPVVNRPKPVAARSNIRAMIEAKRKAMEGGASTLAVDPKTQMKCASPVIRIETPDDSSKKFDGGFFNVTTPGSRPITPKSGKRKSMATPLPHKPVNKRLSALIMFSTNKIRKSCGFEEPPDNDGTTPHLTLLPSSVTPSIEVTTPKRTRGPKTIDFDSVEGENVDTSTSMLLSPIIATRDDIMPDKIQRRKSPANSKDDKSSNEENIEKGLENLNLSVKRTRSLRSRQTEVASDNEAPTPKRGRRSLAVSKSEMASEIKTPTPKRGRKSLAVSKHEMASEIETPTPKRGRKSLAVTKPETATEIEIPTPKRGRKSLAVSKSEMASEIEVSTPTRGRRSLAVTKLDNATEYKSPAPKRGRKSLAVTSPEKEEPGSKPEVTSVTETTNFKKGRRSMLAKPQVDIIIEDADDFLFSDPPAKTPLKTPGRKTRVRASTVPDLISFESPVPPQSPKPSGEPHQSFLTPRRSSRLSIAQTKSILHS